MTLTLSLHGHHGGKNWPVNENWSLWRESVSFDGNTCKCHNNWLRSLIFNLIILFFFMTAIEAVNTFRYVLTKLLVKKGFHIATYLCFTSSQPPNELHDFNVSSMFFYTCSIIFYGWSMSYCLRWQWTTTVKSHVSRVPEWVAGDLFSDREEKLQKRWEEKTKKMVEIGCSLFLVHSASYSGKSQS